jgi:anti-sigma B factor antagonist
MPEQDAFQLIREDLADDVSVVALRGDADRFQAEAVTAAIDKVRDDGRHVVMEVSDTTYIDSTMIAALVATSEQGRRRAGPLVVICGNDRLRRSLRIKGLESILAIAGDREQALGLLAQQRA